MTGRITCMKRKTWLLIIIGLVIIVGIGGKVYMDHQREISKDNEENEKIQIVQQNIALYLVQHYQDVNKIEFRELNEVEGIGYDAWSVSVDVNDDHTISFSIDDLSNVEDATVRHHPKTFDLEKKDEDLTQDLDDVQIIYWEDEE